MSGGDLGVQILNNKFFDQKSIEKWGVFYQDRDSIAAKTFVAMMEKVLQKQDYLAKPMAMFPINGNNIDLWYHEIKEKLLRKGQTDVQVIILLIPGKNGKSQLYRELKRMTLQEIPVISQIILTGTVNFGKNLKSITTKILAQICAKTGGIPWIIDKLPLFDKKIMICGLDSFHDVKGNCKSVLGFVSTYNRSATKYWSKSIIQNE